MIVKASDDSCILHYNNRILFEVHVAFSPKEFVADVNIYTCVYFDVIE